MLHQRHKARAITSKNPGAGAVPPPMPPMPDQTGMSSSPPMPGGMSDPSAMAQGSSDMPQQAPTFCRGGSVK